MHMAFKHNPANMLTMVDEPQIDKLFVSLWNVVRDEDIEISIHAMRILNLLSDQFDTSKMAKQAYRHVIKPIVGLLVQEIR